MLVVPSSSGSLSLPLLLLPPLLLLLKYPSAWRRFSVGDCTRTGVCRRTIFEIMRLFLSLLCSLDRLPVL
jgi:hypothetical protein